MLCDMTPSYSTVKAGLRQVVCICVFLRQHDIVDVVKPALYKMILKVAVLVEKLYFPHKQFPITMCSY